MLVDELELIEGAERDMLRGNLVRTVAESFHLDPAHFIVAKDAAVGDAVHVQRGPGR